MERAFLAVCASDELQASLQWYRWTRCDGLVRAALFVACVGETSTCGMVCVVSFCLDDVAL